VNGNTRRHEQQLQQGGALPSQVIRWRRRDPVQAVRKGRCITCRCISRQTKPRVSTRGHIAPTRRVSSRLSCHRWSDQCNPSMKMTCCELCASGDGEAEPQALPVGCRLLQRRCRLHDDRRAAVHVLAAAAVRTAPEAATPAADIYAAHAVSAKGQHPAACSDRRQHQLHSTAAGG